MINKTSKGFYKIDNNRKSIYFFICRIDKEGRPIKKYIGFKK